jgi:hypothetical protein
MMCESLDCEYPAKYLFRVWDGRISAYCPDHATEKASTQGVELPKEFDWRMLG